MRILLGLRGKHVCQRSGVVVWSLCNIVSFVLTQKKGFANEREHGKKRGIWMMASRGLWWDDVRDTFSANHHNDTGVLALLFRAFCYACFAKTHLVSTPHIAHASNLPYSRWCKRSEGTLKKGKPEVRNWCRHKIQIQIKSSLSHCASYLKRWIITSSQSKQSYNPLPHRFDDYHHVPTSHFMHGRACSLW